MLKGFVNEEKGFVVNKDSLEVLILNYIFSNLEGNKIRTRYAGNGFAELKQDKDKNVYINLEYKVFTNYNFQDGDNEQYEDLVQISLKVKEEYSKDECNKIAKEMYLSSANNVAFILKILNSDIKFI